jgi:hypothetical protein
MLLCTAGRFNRAAVPLLIKPRNENVDELLREAPKAWHSQLTARQLSCLGSTESSLVSSATTRSTPALCLTRIAALSRRRVQRPRLARILDAAVARVRREARPPFVLLAAGQGCHGSRLLLVPACNGPSV